ncbi:hypothetical protein PR202_gb12331 [Eleusine coracana subsp. coracana]|uniref:3-oxo-5-alpha-steroid 4-dehydrogenase C-terminal domain-containing protein n=1 Tax=Eleusine coracana subsp. coracana TaxID=191504 RepID=A0AAV5EPR5_ELECO|nr:hypothetical protein PR202_gb12331 [Eleusine coracana subsp. coracana]
MWPAPPFLYPPLELPFMAALSAVSVVSGVSLGVSELRGENVPYSKFSRAASGHQRCLPSRVGMLLTYVPALVAVLASFAVSGVTDGPRAGLLGATLSVHFVKRVLEVIFLHRYSGNMPLVTVLTVSIGYLLSSVMMIYEQHINRSFPDPPVDLLYPGVLVFAVGIIGNFYHHYLLSRLRSGGRGDGAMAYTIPRGGLFELVACPHYLFEIVVFLGFAMIAQTVFSLAVAFSTAAYLAGRSCATRRWYVAKFEEFPERMKAVVPFVF